MHIALAAETIFHLGWFPITNSLLMALIVSAIWITIALLPKNTKGRLYTALEAVIEGMIGVIESVVGHGKVARQIFPMVATFFIMILTSNWLGLLPGIGSIGFFEGTQAAEVQTLEENVEHGAATETLPLTEEDIEPLAEIEQDAAHGEHEGPVFVPLFRPVNTDLNMTLAIALVSVFMTQVFSIMNIQFLPYLKKFFNFKNPILFFVGILEIISEFVKILSFSFRMFGNLFAGEVLLVVMFSLVPFVAPIPFLGIELFAGFIQALIFSMLTVVFINSGVQTHEAH